MRKFIRYMITDPSYPVNTIFEALKINKPDFVCYRNKEYYNEREILDFISFAKQYSKIFINYDSLKNKELLKYFDGIHLPSDKTDLIEKFKNKTVIVSTHNKKEVNKALKADFITYSPVFNSKGRPGKGIQKLNEICNMHNSVIALGGIVTDKEVNEIKSSKATGFGSIRYFLHNFM